MLPTDPFPCGNRRHPDQPHGLPFPTDPRNILRLDASPPAAEARSSALSLAEVYKTYRPVVLVCVRGRTTCEHDAEDLTQGFFAYLLEQNLLARTDAARGNFDAFLRTVLRHYLRGVYDRQTARKRGGGVTFLPLDDADETTLEEIHGVLLPEPARRRAEEAHLDRRWAQTLINHTFDRLADECARQHGTDYLPRLSPFLTHDESGAGEDTGADHARAAAELGLSLLAFRSALHRLRNRYRALLRETITFAAIGGGGGGSAYRARYVDDPYGLRTTLAYDAQGKLIQVTEPGGRYLQITYGVLQVNVQGSVGNQLVVVDHVTASNGQSVFYGYMIFGAGQGQAGYAALQTVSYRAEGWYGYYSYQDSNNGSGGRPQLLGADDPHYPGPIVKLQRGLAQQASVPAGLIQAEISDLSTTTVSTFNPAVSATDHTEQRGDMTEEDPSLTPTAPVRYFGYAYGDYQISNTDDYQGKRTFLGYNQYTNYLDAVVDRRGHQTNLYKEPILGRVISMLKPDGSSPTYQYGSDPLVPYYLTRRTDDAGHATVYTRDPVTHLATRVDYPDGG